MLRTLFKGSMQAVYAENRLPDTCSLLLGRSTRYGGGSDHSPCYSTIDDAYQHAESGKEIRVASGVYPENLLLNKPVEVALSGGWNIDYDDNTEGQSIIAGALTIAGGTVIVEGIVIEGTDSLARTKKLQLGCWMPGYWSKWVSLR